MTLHLHAYSVTSEVDREYLDGTPNRPRRLDIVIPALNEERRIGATIAAIDTALADIGLSARVIVVDNGSVDGTAATVQSIDAGLPVDLISCAQRGKGAAVRAGIRHSSAEFVAYCDADLSTPPSYLGLAVDLLEGGMDVVLGSRRAVGAQYVVRQPMVRRTGSKVFRMLAAPVVGDITDTQCGFKVLRGDVARSVFSEMTLNGFAFDVELVARTRASRLNVVELPVQWSNDEETTFNVVSDGIRAFRDVVRVKRLMSAPAGLVATAS